MTVQNSATNLEITLLLNVAWSGVLVDSSAEELALGEFEELEAVSSISSIVWESRNTLSKRIIRQIIIVKLFKLVALQSNECKFYFI